MSLSKVRDMNVITYRSTIFGVVVIAKDGEIRTTTDGNLSKVWEEIVRNSKRIFAKCAGRVSACWVKVAKGCCFPFWVGGTKVFDNILARDFGASVWTRWASWTDFYQVNKETKMSEPGIGIMSGKRVASP